MCWLCRRFPPIPLVRGIGGIVLVYDTFYTEL
nr:MAG TPA: hypothetical protein [Caudoviricetes sp.]DAS49112.1 MAG TPA: hypothetical protein [Caudoviricetes sp.]DAU65596.1 MAG TPA: hypothetical protein [Caudoviricetes sp.]